MHYYGEMHYYGVVFNAERGAEDQDRVAELELMLSPDRRGSVSASSVSTGSLSDISS